MIVIGIDPGKGGGVGVLRGKNITLRSTHIEPIGMANIIHSAQNTSYIENEKLKVYIENVHAFPTDGRSSAFKFGMNYGTWIGILGALKIEPIKVDPRVWMKSYSPLSKIKKERKNELKNIAQELFPDVRVTLKTSDAALIAFWGMNNEE